MRLKYISDYLSIRDFNEVDLPKFTILTGRNGSGKTQLLKSITLGHSQLIGVAKKRIKYFSGKDLNITGLQGLTSHQYDQRFATVMQIFRGTNGSPRRNYSQISQQIFHQVFQLNTHTESETALGLEQLQLWEEQEEPLLEAKLKTYRSRIEEEVFSDLVGVLDGQAIINSFQKSHGLIHLVNDISLRQNFVADASAKGILNTSLGALFSQYKINQFRWAQFESEVNDSPLKFSELLIEYEKTHRKPWDLVNTIFKRMNNYSDDKNVFSFRVTNPDSTKLSSQTIGAFSFTPRIQDIHTNEVFDFDNLSSGETVLAALCVSLLEMEDRVGKPKVLLFDEIEASLHPSMTKALLETLRISFVDQGISIILATHSPSTVALANSESLYVVAGKAEKNKVKPVERAEAIEILCEGIASFSDAQIIFNGLKQPVNILTEGYNTVHIQKLLTLKGIDGVGVVEGLEKRTGKTQLQTHAEFLSCIKPENKVLIVLDSDAKAQFDQIVETDTVKKFILPKRDDGYACKGIENMYASSLLEPFLHKKTVEEFGEAKTYLELKDYCKRDFEEHILKNGKVEDFGHFDSLIDKITRTLP